MNIRTTAIGFLCASIALFIVGLWIFALDAPEQTTTVSGILCETADAARSIKSKTAIPVGCERVKDREVIFFRYGQKPEGLIDPFLAQKQAEEYTRRQIIDPFARLSSDDQRLKEMAIRDAGRNAYSAASEAIAAQTLVELTLKGDTAKFSMQNTIAQQTVLPERRYSPIFLSASTLAVTCFLIALSCLLILKNPGFLKARTKNFGPRAPRPYNINISQAVSIFSKADKDVFQVLMLFAEGPGEVDTRDVLGTNSTLKDVRSLQGRITKLVRSTVDDPEAKLCSADVVEMSDGTAYAKLTISKDTKKSFEEVYRNFMDQVP